MDGREFKDPAKGPLKTSMSREMRDNFYLSPDDRAPDGRKVERVFVYGNQDASEGMAREKAGLSPWDAMGISLAVQ